MYCTKIFNVEGIFEVEINFTFDLTNRMYFVVLRCYCYCRQQYG